MKKILVLFITLHLFAMLYSQSNYKPGYIITNQQDTITGWINFRTDANNQKQCEFKQNLELAAKTYLPGDIAGYRFIEEGKYYVSKEIQLNETSQKVFLEYLVKGIMNLYYYSDEVDYYFFENQDGKMEFISQRPERVENLTAYKDNKYKGQVRYLFRDYQPIAQKTDKLEFNQKSMINVVKEYHNEVCTTGESCIVFQNEHPDDKGMRLKFSAYTGLQLSNYIFFYPNIIYVNGSRNNATATESNISPILGVQVNVINPRWSNSFSFQLDASLSQFKGNIPTRFLRYNNSEGIITSYEALATSVRMGVKYTHQSMRKISPTAEAGIACSFLSENKKVLKHTLYGYYLAVGVDYKIRSNTNQAIFIRLVYEDYPIRDAVQVYGKDKISLPHMKIGYTF